MPSGQPTRLNTLQTGAIMAARSRLLTHPALGGLVTPETILAWQRELVRRKWAAC